MHQCLEDLKVLLNSDIPDVEFDRVLTWAKEIIRDAAVKRRKVEILLESFMKDRTNVTTYSMILNTLRVEIEATKDTNPARHAELKLIRNRMYQYKPIGYVAPGRSTSSQY